MAVSIHSDEWIATQSSVLLKALVMKLTGGTANPNTVEAQIQNAKQRIIKDGR